MVNEAGIRDFLINNLDMIEPDLKFIEKEFSLKNNLGAGGRIDILAKYQFGMFVIIEIKKSDKIAREALHELQKYIALFKHEYGLAANKCRCILLSTEWHELLVPFSEFSRIVDYQIDGYQLILDEQGIPIGKKDVNLTLEGEEKLIFPLHKIFWFRTVSKRDIVIQKLVDILMELEIINYYILIVNYKGNYQGVIYPHVIYLVFDVFTTSEKKKIQKNMNIRCDGIDHFDDTDPQPELEEEALFEITNRLRSWIDDTELSTSVKLQNMISNGWHISEIRTNNKYVNSLISDQEILEKILGFNVSNYMNFISVITPRIKPIWESNFRKLHDFLYGKILWQIGTKYFLQKVESISIESTITLKVYSGSDILYGLYNYFGRGIRYLPSLEIIAKIPGNTNKNLMLLGFLEWDGRTFPTISSVFNNEKPSRVFGNQQLLFQLREEAFYQMEGILMKKHGLGYSLFEVTIEQNIQPVIRRLAIEEDDTIHLLPITDEVGFSLRDFLINNRSYVYNLCDIISSCSHFGSQ